MEPFAFTLVIISSALHATWNFYAKKSSANSIALLWLAYLCAGLFFAPVCIYLYLQEGVSQTALMFIILTSVIHAVYMYLLGWAYEVGELSFVYPVARGLGIATQTGLMNAKSG